MNQAEEKEQQEGTETMEDIVHCCILEVLELPPETELAVDGELYSYGMDSLRCMELVVMLEEKFECRFPFEHLVLEEIDTMEKICGFLRSEGKEESEQ